MNWRYWLYAALSFSTLCSAWEFSQNNVYTSIDGLFAFKCGDYNLGGGAAVRMGYLISETDGFELEGIGLRQVNHSSITEQTLLLEIDTSTIDYSMIGQQNFSARSQLNRWALMLNYRHQTPLLEEMPRRHAALYFGGGIGILYSQIFTKGAITNTLIEASFDKTTGQTTTFAHPSTQTALSYERRNAVNPALQFFAGILVSPMDEVYLSFGGRLLAVQTHRPAQYVDTPLTMPKADPVQWLLDASLSFNF